MNNPFARLPLAACRLPVSVALCGSRLVQLNKTEVAYG
jgi:hypothetical protein